MPFSFKRLFIAGALVFLTASCKEDAIPFTTTDLAIPEPSTITYTIKKGEHTTGSRFKFVDAPILRFEATFDSTAIYSTLIPGNQADINKLFGVSDCSTDHHSNSARFGWRWYLGRLEIHAYTYYNKKRKTAYIASVQPGQSARYELTLGEKEYVFRVNDAQVTLPRYCTTANSHYLLYPYFGGDETAPHEITIRIKEL